MAWELQAGQYKSPVSRSSVERESSANRTVDGMAKVSTHVLDLVYGRPAALLSVVLELRDRSGAWSEMARGQTDEAGRFAALGAENGEIAAGTYRLGFESGSYYDRKGIESLHPLIQVVFKVRDPRQDYHLPLLVSPHGYTTYRGS
jgi:5-hydroxyisourate hydrolase